MRHTKPFLWGAMLVGVWLLASSDIAPDRYNGWIPYFMERSELERSVFRLDKAEAMTDPGKIWITEDNAGEFIYIVERYKGVHIIDNSDPASPRNRGFIVAPGCMDVAVKDNFIYLDNAVDLVTFDLSASRVTSRLKNYFPEPVSPTGERYDNDSSDMILVGWKHANQDTTRP
jgi:hypothetical protein